MVNTVSLLPGTLSAELDEEHPHVPVLDHMGDFTSELMVIEKRVTRVFGQRLAADESEG